MLGSLLSMPPRPLQPEDEHRYKQWYEQGTKILSPYLKLNRDGKASAEKSADNLNKSEIRDGIAALERAVRLNPHSYSALFFIGKGHEVLDEPKKFYDALAAAGRIDPYHPDIAREECMALLTLGRGEQAVAVAERALLYSPQDAGLVANLGAALLIKGDLARADETARRALSQAPHDKITTSLVQIIDQVRSGKRPRPANLGELNHSP